MNIKKVVSKKEQEDLKKKVSMFIIASETSSSFFTEYVGRLGQLGVMNSFLSKFFQQLVRI
jgi:hypothetical protein